MDSSRTAPSTQIVRQRFQDQIDADRAAEEFLLRAMTIRDQYEPRPAELRVRWWNLKSDDGRCGALSIRGGEIIASVTVTRDDMNWSEVCGVAFV